MEQIKQQAIYNCCNPECEKQATMECPTCIKMNLPPSHFCDQTCFKSFWPLHKFSHKKPSSDAIDDGFKYTGPLRRFPRSEGRLVPLHIDKPDYASTGKPISEMQQKADKVIPICSEEDIEGIKLSCKIGRMALDAAHKVCQVGVTTEEIDRVVHEIIIENDAYPSPLNYFNFPKSVCTSINEVICHGIPDSRPLQDGDICNVDVSVFKNGYHGDLNETFMVGNCHESSKHLVKNTYVALEKAIEICKPGAMFRDCGNVIQQHCDNEGLSVVRTYCGHGCGKMFHCAPQIPHYGKNKAVGFMKEGMIFTIEPMVNQGDWRDVTWLDKWTSTTADGQRSAQFEHQLLITSDGVEVLTARNHSSPALEFI